LIYNTLENAFFEEKFTIFIKILIFTIFDGLFIKIS